jgi:hypothetical protein
VFHESGFNELKRFRTAMLGGPERLPEAMRLNEGYPCFCHQISPYSAIEAITVTSDESSRYWCPEPFLERTSTLSAADSQAGSEQIQAIIPAP